MSKELAYAYDKDGRPLSATGPDTTFESSYNEQGQLTATRAVCGTVENLLSYRYNRRGQRTGLMISRLIVDPVKPTEYQTFQQTEQIYDPEGQLTAMTYNAANQLVKSLDLGPATAQTVASLPKTPEALEKLAINSLAYTYDRAGRMLGTGPQPQNTYGWLDKLTTLALPDGTTATHTYWPDGLPPRRQAGGDHLPPQRPARHHPRHRRPRRRELLPPHLLRPTAQIQRQRQLTRYRRSFLASKSGSNHQPASPDEAMKINRNAELQRTQREERGGYRHLLKNFKWLPLRLPPRPLRLRVSLHSFPSSPLSRRRNHTHKTKMTYKLTFALVAALTSTAFAEFKNEKQLAEWRAEKASEATSQGYATEETAFYTGRPFAST